MAAVMSRPGLRSLVLGSALLLFGCVLGGRGQELRFLHSEVVREVQYAAGQTDIAVDANGTLYLIYQDLLDTTAFSTGLRYVFRRKGLPWKGRTLVSGYKVFASPPKAVVLGNDCHFLWLLEQAGMYWARVRADTVLGIETLLDSTFFVFVDAVRFNDAVIAASFESHVGLDWGARLFRIKGDVAAEIAFPYAKRWTNVVLSPASKRILYVAGRCGEAACLARTESSLSTWEQLGLGTSERAEGLRIVSFGDEVLLFWELGKRARFYPDQLRWTVVKDQTVVKQPEPLFDVEPPAMLLDPVAVAYRDRWVLLICQQINWSNRSSATHYAIYDGDRWTEFRPFVPDSGFVVGNVSATVDETGLIRFAYSGGDGERQIVGYATARVEFPSSAERVEHETPEDFGLQAPYPNPFNGVTEVRFSLARPGRASLCVVDVRGRVVRWLGSGRWAAGPHALRWDGRDDRGEPLPSGVYLVRLEAGGQVATRKVVLVR